MRDLRGRYSDGPGRSNFFSLNFVLFEKLEVSRAAVVGSDVAVAVAAAEQQLQPSPRDVSCSCDLSDWRSS